MSWSSLCALLLLFAGVAAAPSTAQVSDDPPTAETPTERPERAAILVGEVASVEKTRFRIKPWDADLPKRMDILVDRGTRFFQQAWCGRSGLKADQLCLLIPSDEPEDRKLAAEERRSASSAGSRALRVRGLVAIEGKREELTPDLLDRDRVFLRAARGYFRTTARGGVNPPAARERVLTGFITSLKPLTVELLSGPRQVDLTSRAVVVATRTLKAEELKRKETVTVLPVSATGLDGAIRAQVVVRCPEPFIPLREMSRILQREEGYRDP